MDLLLTGHKGLDRCAVAADTLIDEIMQPEK